MAEPDYSGYDSAALLHLLKLRDRQMKNLRKFWLRDAEEALGGDTRALRNRVEMAKLDPIEIVQSAADANHMRR